MSHPAREPVSECCTRAPSTSDATSTSAVGDGVRDKVREGYARIAQTGMSTPNPADRNGVGAEAASGGCCGGSSCSPTHLAGALGYSKSDLTTVPAEANMGLSCGNPTVLASLRPGEVVLDLGSGGGFDCFIAGPKVGPSGRVIGVDMTPEMIARARRAVADYIRRTGWNNVEFRLGEIENLPVADATVDVVISNCVLNLSPDKPRVWREIARVLRPGGRVAISDLALLRPLPDSVRRDVTALVGCIGGAVSVEEIRAAAEGAGLVDLVLTPRQGYVEAMTHWQDPLYQRITQSLPPGTRPADFLTSLDISARKPSGELTPPRP